MKKFKFRIVTALEGKFQVQASEYENIWQDFGYPKNTLEEAREYKKRSENEEDAEFVPQVVE